jgi:hypothetical protein
MSGEEKKEYLKKNFIQPLTDTIPLSSKFFTQSNLEQCFQNNESFANYIQFDIQAIAEDFLNKNPSSRNPTQNKNDENILNGDQLLMTENNIRNNVSQTNFDLNDIVLVDINSKSKNPNLTYDNKISFDVEHYLKSIEFQISEDDSVYYLF